MNKVHNFVGYVRLPTGQRRWNLYFLSDIHYGSRACDTDQLKADVAVIAEDPFAWVIMLGDNFEAISPDDIRYEVDLHDWSKSYCKQIVMELAVILEPIRKKVICGLTGNHEDKFEKRHYTDLAEHLYDRLEVPYLGYSAIFPIKVQQPCRVKRRAAFQEAKNGWETQYNLDVFVHHGAGGGRKPGGKLNRIYDAQLGFEADIYAMGHVHDQVSYISNKIGCARDGGQKQIDKAFVVGATYYKGYMPGSTTYAEKGMLSPSRLGCTGLTIWQNREDVVQIGILSGVAA